jgi:hypothetical protein
MVLGNGGTKLVQVRENLEGIKLKQGSEKWFISLEAIAEGYF